jgi:hypothetical protein
MGLGQSRVEHPQARRESFFEAATVFAGPVAVYLDDGTGTGTLVVIGTSLREVSSTSSTFSGAPETGSSARVLRNGESGPSTRVEGIREPRIEETI